MIWILTLSTLHFLASLFSLSLYIPPLHLASRLCISSSLAVELTKVSAHITRQTANIHAPHIDALNMSRRRNDLTPVRQSPRLVQREDSVPLGRSRLASPDLIEQLTTPVAQSTRIFASRAPAPFSLNAVAIKQEEGSLSNAASRYFVREPSIDSNSVSVTSPSFPRSQLLRGAQFGLHDDEVSASASIFSSSGSSHSASHYQNEEQLASQLQVQQQQQTNGHRRTSGQRKSRPSQDDLPYTPRTSDLEDNDDDIGNHLPRRRQSKSSWPNMRAGQDDNSIWMRSKRKPKRNSRTSNGTTAALHPQDGSLSHDEADDSGKETHWDAGSQAYQQDTQYDGQSHHTMAKEQRAATKARSNLAPTLRHVAQSTLHALKHLAAILFRLSWRDLLLSVLAISFLFSALYIARSPTHTSGSADLPGPSWTSPATPSHKKLEAEISRLTSRLDSLPSQFESQLATRVKQVETRLQAENEARNQAETQRIMQSAKRQVSRLAQEELANIQNSVANSVELMLGQLNRKVDEQLKKRADATQDEFFSHLDKEIRKITQYANDEVNIRLKQSFDETYLSKLINESLETYSQDRTGKVDYASITSGAVLDERGTVHRGYRLNSVWNLPTFLAQGRKVAIGDPIKAITPGASLGQDDCWMTGWNSMLQVNLSSTRVVDQVVLEHPLPGMARTAPRRVIVWGIVDESDRQYYQQFRQLQETNLDTYLSTLLPSAFHQAVPTEYRSSLESMPLLLSYFEFMANGSTLQTFNTTEEAQYYPHGIEAVRFQFIDGWAQYPPICVHRVRLHGSQWPIFVSP